MKVAVGEKVHRGAEQAEHLIVGAKRLTVAEVYPPRVALARGRGAVAVTAAALGAFALLSVVVRSRRSVATDIAITVALQRHRAAWFRQLMRVVSWPGFPPQSGIIPAVLAVSWLVLGYPLEALFQALAWARAASHSP